MVCSKDMSLTKKNWMKSLQIIQVHVLIMQHFTIGPISNKYCDQWLKRKQYSWILSQFTNSIFHYNNDWTKYTYHIVLYKGSVLGYPMWINFSAHVN